MIITDQPLQHLRIICYDTPPGCKMDFSHQPRPSFALALIESGSILFVEDDRSFTVRAGDVVLTAQDSCYYYVTGEEEVSMISLYFGFTRSSYPFADRRYLVQPLPSDEQMRSQLREILAHWEQKEHYFAVLSRFYSLMDTVFRSARYVHRPPVDPRLYPVMDYLDTHCTRSEPISLLADMCGLSSSHFHNIFRQSLGMTPVEYRNRAAIRCAEQLLVDDRTLSIEQVSEAMGFSSASYFRRVFEAFTGVSPREYRKKIR